MRASRWVLRCGGGRRGAGFGYLAFLLAVGLSSSLPPAVVSGEDVGAGSVRLSVALTAVDASEDLPVSGWLVVEPEGASSDRIALRGTGPVELRVPDRRPTRVSVELPSYWARPEVILPNGEDEAVTLALWPAGWLEGTLEVPASHDLPKKLEARFESPPGVDRPVPASIVVCPVDPQGLWRCQVPGGALDLRFRVPGFVSIYKWGLEIAAQSTLEVAPLALKPGASVVGWVVTEDGSPLGWSARATVVPATTAPAAGGAVDLPRRSESTPVLPRGFFHLRGVAPGRYLLRIDREDFAPAKTEVTVLEGRETRLSQPLMLRRPGELEVHVDPPRDPADQPWRVKLSGSSPREEPQLGTVTGEGTFEWRGLGSGEYLLVVESGPSRSPQRWRSERLDFEPGMPPLTLEMAWIQVHGTVRFGEEPVAEAVLLFGGRHGERRLRVETDEQGFYITHLPEPGTWPLVVYSETTGWRTVEPVKVEPPPGARRVKVDVILPETLLEGEVVSSEGHPVEDALVTAFHLQRQQEEDRARSDEEGRFELVGVSPGPVKIWAVGASPDEISRALLVHVAEAQTPESVRLELERLTRVEGRVAAAGHPVAGAEIFPWVQSAGGGFAVERPRILTGVDGRFELLVPPDTIDLDLLVLPPGFAARIQPVALPLRGEIQVAVDDVAGTLVLDLASFRGADQAELRPAATLLSEGARAALPYLNRWARFHGTRADADGLVLPWMRPGRYTLCVPRDGAAERLAGERAREDCASGFLSPNGELRLGKPAS